jgi:hypothetical protein
MVEPRLVVLAHVAALWRSRAANATPGRLEHRPHEDQHYRQMVTSGSAIPAADEQS